MKNKFLLVLGIAAGVAAYVLYRENKQYKDILNNLLEYPDSISFDTYLEEEQE